MFGEIGAWLYKGIGGIKPDEKIPGFKNVLLAPNFVTGLDNFEAVHDGPFGKIMSSWKREGKSIVYAVRIPVNSSADVLLRLADKQRVYYNGKILTVIPVSGAKQFHIQSGSYIFRIE